MFDVLSLVVALPGSGLVLSAPVGPVIGMDFGVCRVGQCGPDSPDFVAGQRDQLFKSGSGAPFEATWSRVRSVWAVTARNAAASMDRVMCRYQASYLRTW